MNADQSAIDDITYDLVSMRYHALKSARHCARFEQDAADAGLTEIAAFVRAAAAADRERAAACQGLLLRLTDPEFHGAPGASGLSPAPGAGEPDGGAPGPAEGAGGHI